MKISRKTMIYMHYKCALKYTKQSFLLAGGHLSRRRPFSEKETEGSLSVSETLSIKHVYYQDHVG